MEKLPVEISARHIHLTREDVEKLFGNGYQLKSLKELSQPGMFAAEEIVKVVSLKDENLTIDKVRIVGPERKYTQFEVSYTDARKLKEFPPTRTSSNIENSLGFKMIGTKGEVIKENGMIAAKRHIHMQPKDAGAYQVKDGQVVKVKVGEVGKRNLIFDDVKIRVSDTYKLACHIDTDEGNAAGLKSGSFGEIVF